MSLGRKPSFGLLKLKLWRSWVSTVVVIMPDILMTRTRATGYVVVPHLRPTIAIIVAIGITQATPRVFPRCWGRLFLRHHSLAFKAILESMARLFGSVNRSLLLRVLT